MLLALEVRLLFLVVAKRSIEAEFWAKMNEVSQCNYKFITETHSVLRGLNYNNTLIIWLASGWKRRDKDELQDLIKFGNIPCVFLDQY